MKEKWLYIFLLVLFPFAVYAIVAGPVYVIYGVLGICWEFLKAIGGFLSKVS